MIMFISVYKTLYPHLYLRPPKLCRQLIYAAFMREMFRMSYENEFFTYIAIQASKLILRTTEIHTSSEF